MVHKVTTYLGEILLLNEVMLIIVIIPRIASSPTVLYEY